MRLMRIKQSSSATIFRNVRDCFLLVVWIVQSTISLLVDIWSYLLLDFHLSLFYPSFYFLMYLSWYLLQILLLIILSNSRVLRKLLLRWFSYHVQINLKFVSLSSSKILYCSCLWTYPQPMSCELLGFSMSGILTKQPCDLGPIIPHPYLFFFFFPYQKAGTPDKL